MKRDAAETADRGNVEAPLWRRWATAYPGMVSFAIPAMLILLILLSAYIGIQRSLDRKASERVNSELRLARLTIDDRLSSSLHLLEGHALHVRSQGSASREQSYGALESLYNSDVDIISTAILSSSGRIEQQFPQEFSLLASDFDPSSSFRAYERAGRGPTVGDVAPSVGRVRLATVTLLVPLDPANADRSRVLLANLRLRSVRTWLEPFSIGERGGLVLIDRRGVVIASSQTIGSGAGEVYRKSCRDCRMEETRTNAGWKLIAILPNSDTRRDLVDIVLTPLIAGALAIAALAFIGTQVAALSRLSKRQQETLAEARMTAEQNLRNLESGLIPRIPSSAEWDIVVAHLSASRGVQIGGDFFDAFTDPDGRLIVIIGDVSGKGISAAALANTTRSSARAFFETMRDPAEVLARLNNHLLGQTPKSLFVTMLVCVIYKERLDITSAGHPPPLVALSKDKVSVAEVRPGLPLGAFAGSKYTVTTLTVPEKAGLVLYTDGLTEARGVGGFFGMERLHQSFRQSFSADFSAAQIKDRILFDAVSWTENRFTDDLGILVAKRTGFA